MDHTTMWLAHERTIEARQRAAEDPPGARQPRPRPADRCCAASATVAERTARRTAGSAADGRHPPVGSGGGRAPVPGVDRRPRRGRTAAAAVPDGVRLVVQQVVVARRRRRGRLRRPARRRQPSRSRPGGPTTPTSRSPRTAPRPRPSPGRAVRPGGVPRRAPAGRGRPDAGARRAARAGHAPGRLRAGPRPGRPGERRCLSSPRSRPTPSDSTPTFAGATLERFTPIAFTALKTAIPAPEEAYGQALVFIGRRGKQLLADFGDGHLRRAPHAGRAPEARREAVGQAPRRPGPLAASPTVGRCCSPRPAPSARPACGWSPATRRPSRRSTGSGPTPTPSTPRRCAACSTCSRTRLHGFLRDQHRIAGLGRRLANEICHRAHLSPFATTTQARATRTSPRSSRPSRCASPRASPSSGASRR